MRFLVTSRRNNLTKPHDPLVQGTNDILELSKTHDMGETVVDQKAELRHFLNVSRHLDTIMI
jgi:hypothetical protein